MGRSTASCLKIITCGSDSVENDDLQAPENKGSSDKRGWSFRKRSSSRHRVLSNTVISEMPASLNKESSETSTVNLETQATTTFTEKTPAMPWTENKPKLSTLVNLEVSDNRVAAKDDTVQDVPPDESVIVVIQAAVRGVLAQKEMLKLKNIVRLQAVVRGHLVRRHAVGTLRCVQAIVKLQTLVRARHARITFKGSYTEVNPDGNHGKEIKNLLTKPSVVVGTSMEKLLSNKFVHQLLESTPKTKRIHIKCDSSRSDSAWKWLERWMSASSVGVECSQKPESRMVQQEQDEVECDASQVEGVFPAESCESTNVEDNTTASLVPSKSEENLIGYDEDNFVFQACQTTSSAKIDDVEPPQPENPGLSTAKEGCLELLHSQTQKDSVSQLELKSNETDSEQSTRCMKRSAPEQGETEGRKYAFGTRKATNPAFIAVQSKFEELSSTANSERSTSSYKQDDVIELNLDTVSSSIDAGLRTTETDLAENSLLHTSSVKVGTSECGTEISVSSTLDSPDRIEIGMIDVENEIELSDEETSDAANTKKVDIEANNGETSILGSDLVDSLSVQPEKRDTVNEDDDEHVNPVTAEDSLMEKEKSETNASNSAQIELDPHTGHEMYRSSPEASPRSHMTVPEPQETPSSQVSVKAKRTKRNRSSSDQKRRSFLAGKSSPSNPIQDSGVRNSLEQLPKENKSGKRRDSFGLGRPDYVDQEPRDSNASNSLPSYMQATESAKAKALANSSPRSSPDVQDKEIYIKKRHSLPGANGRQGSPRIQRPTSRAQQGANGNGHPHERKWQR